MKQLSLALQPCFIVVTILLLVACGDTGKSPASTDSTELGSTAFPSVQFLAGLMDKYHNRFPVYDDVSSAGNHFVTFGKIPNGNALVSVNGSWISNPHSGATCIRFQFNDSQFAGFYMMNGILPSGVLIPIVNFGDTPNAGINLSNAISLTFWVRGERGGELIDFFVAGVGRDAQTGQPVNLFPDSSPRHPSVGNRFRLTTQWQQVTIDVKGLNLSYVLGALGWVATHQDNPQGATFYVDDIQFNLDPSAQADRMNQPRFLISFETAPFQPNPFDANSDDDIDLVLRNLAFVYDNALVLLAFLADGSPDSIRRARLIGDAFVYASRNDRFFTDGRLRTAYMAGDISLPPGWKPNNLPNTVPIPGFYWEPQQKFFEVEQTAIDVGNNAWAMIALLALYKKTAEQSYLDVARRLGQFIHSFRNTAGTYQGFLGGIENPESSSPTLRTYASAEHNIDVYAAFKVMAELSPGEALWSNDALHAQQLVTAMWHSNENCFLAGTIDPLTRNSLQGQLPLDVQAWSLLAQIPFALQNTALVHACLERNHRTTQDGFSGFDFNNDRDGVWFEGTGQVAVVYRYANDTQKFTELSLQLSSSNDRSHR
ncbi:MAG: hypothetical protein QM706_16395 [Nitrospira sp.]